MSSPLLALNFAIALFALINPIGNLPVFAAMTETAAPAARRWIAIYVGLFVVGLLALFYLAGLTLLQVFGISLPAFRIAGGLILLLLGVDMTRGGLASTDCGPPIAAPDHRTAARMTFERIVVPFAIPILVGPGAISAVVIYASQTAAYGVGANAAGLAAIASAACAVVAVLCATPLIGRVLGRVGMTVIVRVLGLILCAMAVQFMLMGAAAATSGLFRPEATAPYSQAPKS